MSHTRLRATEEAHGYKYPGRSLTFPPTLMPHANFTEGVYTIANVKAPTLVVDTKYGKSECDDESSKAVGLLLPQLLQTDSQAASRSR
jgi:hypothetical protein